MKTIKYKKEQIEAMKTLLKHYKDLNDGISSYIEDCPLCEIFGDDSSDDSSDVTCKECVWVKEIGMTCLVYTAQNHTGITENLRNDSNEKWLKDRIGTLSKWIDKYSKLDKQYQR